MDSIKIFYNDKGIIASVATKVSADNYHSFIEIPWEDGKDFLLGAKAISDYVINIDSKPHILVLKNTGHLILKDKIGIRKIEISTIYAGWSIKDEGENQWNIIPIEAFLPPIDLYVTAKDCPFVLHRSIKISKETTLNLNENEDLWI